MRAFAFVLGCLSLIGLALAASGITGIIRGPGNNGALDLRWGPDVFGYTARNSQESDGPTVRWFDISATGTQVTGLTDDNFVGPFPIGWSFRYYWYDVTQFWVGSNGYIKFSTPGQLAQPMPQFPTATNPNDVIGPYVADWFFGSPDPSSCYYQSNGTDTLIVMWKDVTAWMETGNIGNHNFEIVLSGVDSSITFYYGTQDGQVSNNSIAIGIENLTGQIGISCYFGTYPLASSAIRFYYPNPVTYMVHDLAIAGVQNSHSAGFFMLQGDSLEPWLSVRNTGNQPESNFTVNYAVRQINNTLLAQDSSVISTIDPSHVVEVSFPPLWQAATPNVYRAVGTVILSNDAYQANNTIRAELHSVNLPGELYYDDGVMDRDWSWAGGQGGMAMQFDPPVHPCEVTRVRIYVNTTIPDGFDAQIIDDDGPDGAPGTIIWTEHVSNPPAAAFSAVDIPPGEVVIDSGTFYVAWMQSVTNITFGIDSTSNQGISRRAWEYAGGWAENRMAQEADCMIRCTINSFAPNQPPGAFSRVAPPDSSYHMQIQGPIVFRWTRSMDPDGENITYLLDASDEDTTLHFSTTDTTLSNDLDIMYPEFPSDTTVVTWSLFATDGEDTVEASNGSGMFILWMEVAVDENDLSVVRDYALFSYPNPFNPTTEIRYDLPVETEVSLKVFDLMGREVATLVNSRHSPGRYRIEWNPSDAPTGTYFAVLSAGTTVKIQKLLLLK